MKAMEPRKKNTFVQLHILTAYPPSNLNRDESGVPKTAKFGGVERGRISSQCNKYWYRNGDIFENLSRSIRTRHYVALKFAPKLQELEVSDDEIKLWASNIYNLLGGKISDGTSNNGEEALDDLGTEEDIGKWAGFSHKQAIVIADGEHKALERIAQDIADYSKKKPYPEYIDRVVEFRKKNVEKKRARKEVDRGKRKSQAKKNEAADELIKQIDLYSSNYSRSADISLFGRMSASHPDWNFDAACQVAHSITVHPVINEVDYFTAVDDLNKWGAAHVNAAGFNSGVYYLYVCLDTRTLVENLKGDKVLAKNSVEALLYSLITISPGGKQNSYASRAFASFVLAEKGPVQPRTLAAAYLKPIRGENVIPDSITALQKMKDDFDMAYPFAKPQQYIFDVHNRNGKIEELVRFCTTLPELNI
jgi:CRISPR system Cascade subunit CasC